MPIMEAVAARASYSVMALAGDTVSIHVSGPAISAASRVASAAAKALQSNIDWQIAYRSFVCQTTCRF